MATKWRALVYQGPAGVYSPQTSPAGQEGLVQGHAGARGGAAAVRPPQPHRLGCERERPPGGDAKVEGRAALQPGGVRRRDGGVARPPSLCPAGGWGVGGSHGAITKAQMCVRHAVACLTLGHEAYMRGWPTTCKPASWHGAHARTQADGQAEARVNMAYLGRG